MRAPLMGGAFPFPVKYGYSAVGRDTRRAARLRAASASGFFLAPAAMCIPMPGRGADAARGAGREHGDGAEPDVGCRTARRRARAGDRCRCRRVAGRVVAGAHPGRPRHRGGQRSDRAQPLARHFGCGFALPQQAPDRAGADRACLGQRGRAASRAGRAAFEARIIEASWFGDARARRAARRGVPCAAAAPDRDPGRRRRAGPMRGRRSHAERLAAGARTAGRSPLRRAAGRADARSRKCREAMPRILAPGGFATSSPMGRS